MTRATRLLLVRVVVGIVILLVLGAIAVYFFSRERSTETQAPTVTLGKTAYAIGEAVTVTLKNESTATISVAKGFGVLREEGEEWVGVSSGGERCSCGEECSPSFQTLLFGESANFTWDGSIRSCTGTEELKAFPEEPGTYRLSFSYEGDGERETSDTPSVPSEPFQLTRASPETENTNTSAPPSLESEEPTSCATDSDCEVAGCSGQLCVRKGSDALSTCEYKKEYACLTETRCGCFAGSCAWEETSSYRSCLTNVGAP